MTIIDLRNPDSVVLTPDGDTRPPVAAAKREILSKRNHEAMVPGIFTGWTAAKNRRRSINSPARQSARMAAARNLTSTGEATGPDEKLRSSTTCW